MVLYMTRDIEAAKNIFEKYNADKWFVYSMMNCK